MQYLPVAGKKVTAASDDYLGYFSLHHYHVQRSYEEWDILVNVHR